MGSNIGDREAWLAFARERLGRFAHTRVTAESAVRETKPVGCPSEYADELYLNQVVEVETQLDCWAFSAFVHAIENEAGRKRGPVRNVPRTLDIDIITFGDFVCDDPELTLPHPRAKEREFVMVPLREIAPEVAEGIMKSAE